MIGGQSSADYKIVMKRIAIKLADVLSIRICLSCFFCVFTKSQSLVEESQ